MNRRDQGFMEAVWEALMQSFIFRNGSTLHLQLCGISMGISSAPEMANIFLYWIIQYNLELFQKREDLLFYGRFIDDLIMIAHVSNSTAISWIETLEQGTNIFKFTWVTSLEKIDFLDVSLQWTVRNDDLHIRVKPFWNRFSTFLFISQNSSHPPACGKGGIRGELKRYEKLSSDEEGFEKSTSSALQAISPEKMFESVSFHEKVSSDWFNYRWHN